MNHNLEQTAEVPDALARRIRLHIRREFPHVTGAGGAQSPPPSYLRKETKRLVMYLRSLIPAVDGCRQCGRCCGPILCAAVEIERMERAAPRESHSDAACHWLRRGRVMMVGGWYKCSCACYDERPIMCRLYAATEDRMIACPFGAHAPKPLTAAQAHAIIDAYKHVADQLSVSVDELNNLTRRKGLNDIAQTVDAPDSPQDRG